MPLNGPVLLLLLLNLIFSEFLFCGLYPFCPKVLNIILQESNKSGVIESAETFFSSKTKLSDYHGKINQQNFLKWSKNQLLKHLVNPSVLRP